MRKCTSVFTISSLILTPEGIYDTTPVEKLYSVKTIISENIGIFSCLPCLFIKCINVRSYSEPRNYNVNDISITLWSYLTTLKISHFYVIVKIIPWSVLFCSSIVTMRRSGQAVDLQPIIPYHTLHSWHLIESKASIGILQNFLNC